MTKRGSRFHPAYRDCSFSTRCHLHRSTADHPSFHPAYRDCSFSTNDMDMDTDKTKLTEGFHPAYRDCSFSTLLVLACSCSVLYWVSIPPTGIVPFLRSAAVREGGWLTWTMVSIPPTGIVPFLHWSIRAVQPRFKRFPSRLPGLFLFYEGRTRKEANYGEKSFHPAYRDCSFSTATVSPSSPPAPLRVGPSALPSPTGSG